VLEDALRKGIAGEIVQYVGGFISLQNRPLHVGPGDEAFFGKGFAMGLGSEIVRVLVDLVHDQRRLCAPDLK
jgi:hypothetical protein